ncbi:MAG: hypothetical protein V7731_03855 [Amphritea sp.]
MNKNNSRKKPPSARPCKPVAPSNTAKNSKNLKTRLMTITGSMIYSRRLKIISQKQPLKKSLLNSRLDVVNDHSVAAT